MTFKDELFEQDKNEMETSGFDNRLEKDIECWAEKNFEKIKQSVKNDLKEGKIETSHDKKLTKGELIIERFCLTAQYDRNMGKGFYYHNEEDFDEIASIYKGLIIVYCDDEYSQYYKSYLLTNVCRKRKLVKGYVPSGVFSEKFVSRLVAKCAKEGITVNLSKTGIEYSFEY